jgi:hypothetical protein
VYADRAGAGLAAKEGEAAHIEASGHITDDEPTPTSVYTLEEQYDAWEKIASALSDIQTEQEIRVTGSPHKKRHRLSLGR